MPSIRQLWLLLILAVSGCQQPDFPDGPLCQMLTDHGDLAILNCVGVIDHTQTAKIPASQGFEEGWFCVNPSYFADLMAYRADLSRWMGKHCN